MSGARKIVLALVAVLAIVAFTQVDFFSESKEKEPVTKKEESKSVFYKVSHTEELSSWSVAVKSAEFSDSLSQNEVTMFAPSDSAFAQLQGDRYAKMMNAGNKDELRQLIEHHVIRGNYSRDDLLDRKDFATMAGDSLHFSESGDTLKVNTVPVKEERITADNGTIYMIDQILEPSAEK